MAERRANYLGWVWDPFRDLAAGLRLWRLWTAFGYEDLRHQYRRTALGLAWNAISFGAFASVYVLIFGSLNPSHDGARFSTFVVAGFLAWQFIAHVVTMGANVFIGSEGWIKGVKLPLSVHIFKTLWRLALQDGMNLLVAYGLIVLVGEFSSPGLFLGLVAIPLFVALAIPVQIVLGLLCVIYRDVQQFIGTLMRLMFFVTPIIWTPVPGTIRETAAAINPFAYMLALFREPVMTGELPVSALQVWAVLFVLFWGLAILLFARLRPHLVYWL